MRRIASLLLVGPLLVACSWTAFDSFKKDTPFFAFTNKSFGHRIAIAVDREGNGTLALGGPPPPDGGGGMRTYGLGNGKSDPSGLPLSNTAFCEISPELVGAGRACLSATTLSAAGFLNDDAGEHPACFATGYGKLTQEAAVTGPVVVCTGQNFTMRGPTKDEAPKLAGAFSDQNEAAIRALRIALVTQPRLAGVNPPLVLGDEADNAAFFYFKIEALRAPVAFPRTKPGADRFGAAVAIARTNTERPIYFVSAPGAGKIYAYERDAMAKDADPPVHIGCLADPGANFGAVLATGDIDKDGLDDLLTTAGGVVKVFLGKDRPAGTSATDCEKSWPASTFIFACAEVRGASGCSSADFGRSIAVGDFDKNGSVDVAVGAPGATASGVAGAGAVYLFTPAKGTAVEDVRYLGNPEGGAGLGESLAVATIGGQDTLAAGARKGAAYAIWCTGLPDSPSGPRCRR